MIIRLYTHALSLSRSTRLAWASVFVVAVAGAAIMAAAREPVAVAPGQSAAATAPLLSTVAPPLPSNPAVRQVYPYSVIPGGVVSSAELASVAKSDKVVAIHYANFNTHAARVVRVAKPRAVYVSYRKDDKIYWTAKKVILPAGETLLSDGVNEARTRCANRISDVSQLPVAAEEPSLELPNAAADMLDEGRNSTSPNSNVGWNGATAEAVNIPRTHQRAIVTASADGYSTSFAAVGAPQNPFPTFAPSVIDSGKPDGPVLPPAAGNDASETGTGTTDPIGKDESGAVSGPDSERPTPPVILMPEEPIVPGAELIKPGPFEPEKPGLWPPGPLPSVPVQDDIKVGEVPEPSSVGLIVCALGVLGAMRRRRR